MDAQDRCLQLLRQIEANVASMQRTMEEMHFMFDRMEAGFEEHRHEMQTRREQYERMRAKLEARLGLRQPD